VVTAFPVSRAVQTDEPARTKSVLPRRVTTILAGLLLLFLLYLALVAGKTALADLYFSRANRVLNQWTAARALPSVEQWASVRNVMLDALSLDSGNPRILDSLGRVSRWGAAIPERPNLERAASRADALRYFRASLDRRPTSAFTWANLALEKFSLGEYDEEFEHAIRMASFFGPWLPSVQLAVANAGLGAWFYLVEKDTLDAVRETVTRGLTWPDTDPRRERHAGQLLQIATHYRREELVCAWGIDDVRLSEWCEAVRGEE
jgi:hypothetical protein